MRRATLAGAWLAVLALAGAAHAGSQTSIPVSTTSGAIAIANLDHAIDRAGDDPGVEDLLLARSRFLGDYAALDRAAQLAEGRHATVDQLFRRARVRSALAAWRR